MMTTHLAGVSPLPRPAPCRSTGARAGSDRDGIPDWSTCMGRHRLLAGHLRLLAPIAVAHAPCWDDPKRTTLAKATAASVERLLTAGLPTERQAAYLHVQELALACWGLLGLVLDWPGEAR